MTPLATAMEIVFVAVWFMALAMGIYSARYMLRFHAAWFSGDRPWWPDLRKSLIGMALFGGLALVGLGAGFVADQWGGGWR